MPNLSIIIPIFNTDKALFEECLNSIFSSTLTDFEVVIVDDGSTEEYSEIQKKYFGKINYIKTENQGTLKARALGAKVAKADYICYVDSDDSVSFCYHEAMLEKAQKTDGDIVINDWAFHSSRTKSVCTKDELNSLMINDDNGEFLNRFFKQAGRMHSFYVLWNKIFKKEILIKAFDEIEKLNIEKLLFAEDVLICYYAATFAKNVSNLHLGYYFYRVHDLQQVAVFDENKLASHITAMSQVFDIIEKDLVAKNLLEKYKADFLSWKQLLCSVQWCEAKKYKSEKLNSLICEKYNGCQLKKPAKDYGKAYLGQKVLPSNISIIDEELKKVYYSNKSLKVYAKPTTYSYNMLESMKKNFNKNFIIVSKDKAEIKLTKEKISFKNKLLHNDFVYRLGMFLFPKGSKIRKKLKSKI